MSSLATTAGAVTTLADMVPRHDRVLPVDEALASLFPAAGLQRGHVIGCSGSAATSLALAVVARAATAGAWVAAVGMPTLGVEAAAEAGVPLARLVLVDIDESQPAASWAERVGAAADGFEIILTRPPHGAERMLRKVQQRLQARGVVLVAVSDAANDVASRQGRLACDVELATFTVEWLGIGTGHGGLVGRRVSVTSNGRRSPRPLRAELWLPGPEGRPGRVG
ncbi:MAG TPA: hypothetical protein VMM60_18405 [Ilumatobacter sp.]|nr:hypothetical protein [Ilumatobacter sp.]